MHCSEISFQKHGYGAVPKCFGLLDTSSIESTGALRVRRRQNFDLNGIELQKAILETFNNRKTHIEEIVAFNDEFIDDKVRIKRWDSFIKKNQIDVYISFKETMEHIKRLLFPIVKSIIDNYEYNLKWNHRTLNWSINGE